MNNYVCWWRKFDSSKFVSLSRTETVNAIASEQLWIQSPQSDRLLIILIGLSKVQCYKITGHGATLIDLSLSAPRVCSHMLKYLTQNKRLLPNCFAEKAHRCRRAISFWPCIVCSAHISITTEWSQVTHIGPQTVSSGIRKQFCNSHKKLSAKG